MIENEVRIDEEETKIKEKTERHSMLYILNFSVAR